MDVIGSRYFSGGGVARKPGSAQLSCAGRNLACGERNSACAGRDGSAWACGRLPAAGQLGKSKGLGGAGAPLLRAGVGWAGVGTWAGAGELLRAIQGPRPKAGRRQAAMVLATGQWSAPEGSVVMGRFPMGAVISTHSTGRQGRSPRRCCCCLGCCFPLPIKDRRARQRALYPLGSKASSLRARNARAMHFAQTADNSRA